MRPSTAPGRHRFSDDELLDAARAVFHEQGFHAAQMSEMARRAGTSKPTLYARLGSKEQVFVRVLEREAEALSVTLARTYEQSATLRVHEMVVRTTRAFFRYVETNRAGYDLLFRSERGAPGREIADAAVEGIIARVGALVHGVLERTGRAPRPESVLLAAAAVGVSRQVCQHALDHGLDFRHAERIAASFIAVAMREVDGSVDAPATPA